MSDVTVEPLRIQVDMSVEERVALYQSEYGLTEVEAIAVTTPIKAFYKDAEALAFALEARDKIYDYNTATKTGEWRKSFKHDF